MQKVAELDWSMKKALVEQSRDHTWELSLTNDDQWRTRLREHFEKIFYRQQQVTVTAKIRGILDQLTAQCKKTPWVPFSIEDLQAVKEKWKKGKSCGPDMVSHEAPKAILPHPTWGNRLLEIFNDMLYTICVVKSIETGATVVLAKITQPVTWGDTRPITLSSVLLKTFGQLLLRRAGDCIQAPARLQWCRRGRQGSCAGWHVLHMIGDWILYSQAGHTQGIRLDIPGKSRKPRQPASVGTSESPLGSPSVGSPTSRSANHCASCR